MPLIHTVIEPKFLSRKELDKSYDNELEAVTNNTLVSILKQLSCIVRCASRIFDSVGEDLHTISCRSQRLKDRIKNVEEVVTSLNAKSETIVCDLRAYSQVKQHYVSSQPQKRDLFLPENRPHHISSLYDNAVISLVHIMREIDQYREDGCRSSKYFICTPVFKDKSVDLEIETRRPASLCTARDWQSDDELGIPEVCQDKEDEDDNGRQNHSADDILRLPSPEERTHALSLKYPYSDVPIDVTGSGFQRMASFRRSLIQQVEFFTRKKKKKGKSGRRNTISGGISKDQIGEILKKSEKKNGFFHNSLSKKFTLANFNNYDGSEDDKISPDSTLKRPPSVSKGVQTTDENTDGDSGPSKEKTENKKTIKSKLKSYIPISTLSQAMTVAVKLRDNAKSTDKIDDGGQSSSGNWSASSSTRASMESDNTRLVNSPELVRSSSQTSLSKDSALSDGTLQVDGGRSPDSNCGPLSDHSSSPECVKKNNSFDLTKHTSSLKTMKWLHGVNKEGIAGDTTDGTSTTGTLTPVTGKRTFSPFDLPLAFVDDEESSVYSVDADGYYTSMHTDSGLRSSVIVKDDTIEDFPSTQGEESSETLSSHSSATAHEICVINKLDSKEKGSIKKIPPPPPPRKCTLNKNLVLTKSTEDKEKSFESQSATESPDQSPSPSSVLESDIDSEFHEKTSINASRIPSMCIVTPSPSDDEGMKSDANNNNNNIKKEIVKPLSKVSNDIRPLSSSPATKMSSELSIIGLVATSRPNLQAHENTFKYQANNSQKPQIYSNTTAAAKENSNFRTSTSNSASYSNTGIGLPNQKSINSGSEAVQKTNSEDSFTANGTIPGSRSDFTKKYFMHNNSQATPLIPLKYAQHITITPGARKMMPNPNRSSFFSTTVGEMETDTSVREQPIESKYSNSGRKDVDRYYSLPKSPVTNGENDSVASYASTKSSTSMSNGSSKIIYATNSLEKKKNGNSTNGAQRPGAYVSLDPSGKIIYSTNSLNRKEQKLLTNGHADSNTSEFNSSSQGTSVCSDSSMHNLEVNKPGSKLPKNSQSELSSLNLENPNGSYHERNYCKYDTNTLPRRRSSSSASPIPVFPTQNKNVLPYGNNMGNNIGSTHNPIADRANSSAYSNPNNVVWRYTPNELSSKRGSVSFPVNGYQNVQAAKQNSQLSHCNSLRNPYPQDSRYYVNQTADNSWRKNSENSTSYLPVPISRMKPFQSEAEERRKYESPFIPPGHANQLQSTKMGMHSKNITNSNQPTANSQSPTLQSKFTSGIASSLFSKKYNQENSSNNSISYRNFTPPDIYAFHPVSSSTPVPPANEHSHRLHQNDLSPISTNRPSSDYGSFHGKIYGPAEKMGICQSYPSTSYQNNVMTSKNSVLSSNQPNNEIRNQFANRNYSSTLPNPKTKKEPPAATLGTSRKSTMKTDDLFAKIHESKKRLNIKTDFDRSLSPVSSDGMSRSSSSTSLRSCPQMDSNGTPQRMLTAGDRRSWAGSFPLSPSSSNQGTPGNRRSWAMDRLGPSKPTSMHDFKMLLLQAGQGGSHFERQRISAAEMLKLSSSKQDTNSLPIKKSQASNISATGKENKNFNFDSPNRNSPTSFRPIFSNGYNSLNRGRNRLNLSHTKTDILSTPIPEDNSEESDSSDDNKAIGTIV